MSVLLGGILGVGLLTVASVFMWPRREVARAAFPLVSSLRTRLLLAGFAQVPALVFLAISAIVGVLLGAVTFATLGITALGLVALIVGASLPWLVISARARARRRTYRAVWPDVVDTLVAGVRSGLALRDALSSLTHNGPPPVREAFGAFEQSYRSTGSFNVSVDSLKVLLDDPTADRILETLRMAREVGGTDLTPILRSLSMYLREEAAVRAEIDARQSWVRNAAKLGAIAPWVILALLASRPEGAAAYNTPSGAAVIALGAVITVFAYRVMVSLGRLPVEGRWFQ
jgi:tight adherence protein B